MAENNTVDCSSDSEEETSSADESFSDDGDDEEYFTFNELLTGHRVQMLFQRWFWEGSMEESGERNCNQLVRMLNSYNRYERVMVEKRSDIWFVYGIVLNNHPFNREIQGKHWKLIKIGCTQKNLTNENVIEEEKRIIKKDLVAMYPNVLYDSATTDAKPNTKLHSVNIAIIFVSEKSPSDSSTEQQWKNRIKEKFGKLLTTKSAKKLGLAFPTDWVFTTQTTITRYKAKADEVKKDKGSHVCTAMKEFHMKASVRSLIKEDIPFMGQIIRFK